MPIQRRTYLLTDNDKVIRAGARAEAAAYTGSAPLKGLPGGRYRVAHVRLDVVRGRPLKVLKADYRYQYLADDGTYDQWAWWHGCIAAADWLPITGAPSTAMLAALDAAGITVPAETLSGGPLELTAEARAALFRWQPTDGELALLRDKIMATRAIPQPPSGLTPLHGPYRDNEVADKGNLRDAQGRALSGIFLKDSCDHRSTLYIDSGYLVDSYSYPAIAHDFASQMHSHWNQLLFIDESGRTPAWHYGATGAHLGFHGTGRARRLDLFAAALERFEAGQVPALLVPFARLDTRRGLSLEDATKALEKMHRGQLRTVQTGLAGDAFFTASKDKIGAHVDLDKLTRLLLRLDAAMQASFGYYVSIATEIETRFRHYAQARYCDIDWPRDDNASQRLDLMMLFGLPPEHLFDGIF